MNNIQEILCKFSGLCPRQQKSIIEQHISTDFMEAFGDVEILLMKKSASDFTSNPEIEPYHIGSFEGFRILVVWFI
jgi:hypothetical protein